MYIFHYCKQINDYLFDEKIDSNQKQVIIDKYNLQKIGKIKVYWENNVKITSFNNDLSFEYIDDKSITYDSEKDILIEEYDWKLQLKWGVLEPLTDLPEAIPIMQKIEEPKL